MKVCKNFIEKPESTTCQNCGCEKWEHDVLGKGILEYIKNMPSAFTMSDEEFQKTYFSENKPLTINIPTGQKAMELFDKALEEEFNKELRKNSFLTLDEFL